MFKLKDEAAGWEPIAGVPWRDMGDEEFAAVSSDYDKQFPDQPGSLARWFDHVADKPVVARETSSKTKDEVS